MDRIKNSQGSTSVLIVVMMIALLAFGMAAVTTAAAGYRLSRNTATFSQTYYDLEGQAQEMMFDLLDVAIRSGEASGPFVDILYAVLVAYSREHDGFEILEKYPDAILVGYKVSENSERAKTINVKILIQEPAGQSSIDDILHVVDWYETQEGIGEIKDTIGFEDPFEGE